MLRFDLRVTSGLLLLCGAASAQVSAVQIRDGDVYLQQASGWGKLTHDGRATGVAASRDGSLVAYIRHESGDGDEEMDTVSLCIVTARSCRIIVAPERADEPERNLTGLSSLAFSYQAKANTDGSLTGSLFFLASAWATSGAVHRVTLGPNPAISYVTPSNALSVVPSGRFAGALDVSQHIYAPQGGSCDQARIFDPNTRKILQTIPTPDCQSLHIQ